MKIDHIHIIEKPSYIHHSAFAEVAEAFAAVFSCDVVTKKPSSGKSLAFGVHLPVEDALNPDDIIYQTEQICQGFATWRDSRDWRRLLETHVVWDYSQNNIQALLRYNIAAELVPIRYMPCMTKPEAIRQVEQDIDVLHYGSLNGWRAMTLRSLKAKGLEVKHLFGVYGAERDAYIARSKIVLSLHQFESGIFEIFRCAHLFANRKCVVSESGKDLELDARHAKSCVFVPYDKIAQACLDLLKDESRRKEQEIAAFENFKSPLLSEEIGVKSVQEAKP